MQGNRCKRLNLFDIGIIFRVSPNKGVCTKPSYTTIRRTLTDCQFSKAFFLPPLLFAVKLNSRPVRAKRLFASVMSKTGVAVAPMAMRSVCSALLRTFFCHWDRSTASIGLLITQSGRFRQVSKPRSGRSLGPPDQDRRVGCLERGPSRHREIGHAIAS